MTNPMITYLHYFTSTWYQPNDWIWNLKFTFFCFLNPISLISKENKRKLPTVQLNRRHPGPPTPKTYLKDRTSGGAGIGQQVDFYYLLIFGFDQTHVNKSARSPIWWVKNGYEVVDLLVRCFKKVKHIKHSLPNGGLLVIYHGRK